MSSGSVPLSRRARVTVALVLSVVLALAGCSSGKPLHTSPASPAVNTGTAPAGLPSFYAVPDPLPPGKPGQIIRQEPVEVPGLHGTMLRVMYHSKSATGDDIAVTGLIAIPKAPAPSDGYEVIAWAHGTVGIADKCAPSLTPDQSVPLANKLLDAGYVIAATDYQGLGTPGRHPYIVGDSEAHGVLDSVRAARNIEQAHAGDRYLVWGHSQGGHAAMFALHLADSYVPELHLVGVVAGAPPSQLDLVYQALKTSPFSYYLLMAAAGFNTAYGDQAAPLDEVITPAGMKLLADVDTGCTSELAKVVKTVDVTSLIKADPATVPAWKKLLDENDPGKFTKPVPEPLLIIQGGNDEQIPVASTQLLFGQMCKIGQDTERWIYPGQSHAGVIPVSADDMLTWIADRFAGKPNPDPYRPAGQPDVQTENCPQA
jgi:alpha-beta hydrolase superfamily lysophospholipase